ncbi:MAG: 7-cyano-7-deazaguanine synthase [Clostridiales bacterium]|nr:7-cyano-7-deazaguanine synthase [Clostridiales bacterium]
MSGGVDSSAAAWLLKQQGYTVVGITLRLHGQADRDCADARRVCDKLGMEHRILDGRERFRDIVVSRFIADYYAGRTPNPCVVCNRRIKFGWMLDEALRNGADGIATGHYANVAFDPASGRWQLRCSHSGKDQSYMLYGLSQGQLAHTLFPLQDREKEEVRRLAKEAGLPVADKGDSMEIALYVLLSVSVHTSAPFQGRAFHCSIASRPRRGHTTAHPPHSGICRSLLP